MPLAQATAFRAVWLAFIPCVCWALGSVCSSRATRGFGAVGVNRWRLALALAALGSWLLMGPGLPSAGWGWLLLSGAVGLGIGDLAMLLGYQYIGPRITVLILLCGAVPIAGLSEWWWLGETLTWRQVGWIAVILAGVALVVGPGAKIPAKNRRAVLIGLGLGVVAALGQGLGTTISRLAYAQIEAAGGTVDGVAATWQRMLGGLAVTLAAGLAGRSLPDRAPVAMAADRPAAVSPADMEPSTASAATSLARWWWLLGATVLGPILGLGAYQLALTQVPGAVVQAIASLVPVVVIPVAWLVEGDRPGWRGVVGGVIACGGAAALALLG